MCARCADPVGYGNYGTVIPVLFSVYTKKVYMLAVQRDYVTLTSSLDACPYTKNAIVECDSAASSAARLCNIDIFT